jgi:hypothetical protein
VMESDGTPSPDVPEPPGTRSQIVSYWEVVGGNLQKVALAHRYMRPDGSLGASGFPDPKQVRHEGQKYALHPRPPR